MNDMNNNTDDNFDADLFLQANIEDANATKVELVPEDEYANSFVERITKPKFFPASQDKPAAAAMEIFWRLDQPELAEALGRSKLEVRQQIWLDIVQVEEDGMLRWTIASGKGKNVQLGKVRAALDQNNPGQLWNPNMLVGAGPAIVKVAHEPDKKDSTKGPYEKVVAVAKQS